MKQVIAILDESDDKEEVVALAGTLARLLGLDAGEFRVTGPTRTRAAQVIEAVEATGVDAAVLSVRGASPVCWEVIPKVSKPLLVLPRHVLRVPGEISKILVPLDGTPETAAGVAPITARLADAGADVVAMHVFDKDTVPAFWDQASHSRRHWDEEFVHRNLPSASLEVARGLPAEQVTTGATDTGADLIVMGWSHNLRSGKARTVRHALMDGAVPVLLVSTGPGGAHSDSGLSALDGPAHP